MNGTLTLTGLMQYLTRLLRWKNLYVAYMSVTLIGFRGHRYTSHLPDNLILLVWFETVADLKRERKGLVSSSVILYINFLRYYVMSVFIPAAILLHLLLLVLIPMLLLLLLFIPSSSTTNSYNINFTYIPETSQSDGTKLSAINSK